MAHKATSYPIDNNSLLFVVSLVTGLEMLLLLFIAKGGGLATLT